MSQIDFSQCRYTVQTGDTFALLNYRSTEAARNAPMYSGVFRDYIFPVSPNFIGAHFLDDIPYAQLCDLNDDVFTEYIRLERGVDMSRLKEKLRYRNQKEEFIAINNYERRIKETPNLQVSPDELTPIIRIIEIEKTTITDAYGRVQPAFGLYVNGGPWRWNKSPLVPLVDSYQELSIDQDGWFEIPDLVSVGVKVPLIEDDGSPMKVMPPYGFHNVAHDILRHILLLGSCSVNTSFAGELVTGQAANAYLPSMENEWDYWGLIANFADNLSALLGHGSSDDFSSCYSDLSDFVKPLLMKADIPDGTRIRLEIDSGYPERLYISPLRGPDGQMLFSKCKRPTLDHFMGQYDSGVTETNFPIGMRSAYTGFPYQEQQIVKCSLHIPDNGSLTEEQSSKLASLFDPSAFFKSFAYYETLRRIILEHGFLPLSIFAADEEQRLRLALNLCTCHPDDLICDGGEYDPRRSIHPEMKNAQFARMPPPPFA